MTVEIRRNAPPLPRAVGRPSVYPLRDMAVGDAFFRAGVRIQAVCAAARRVARATGWRFTCRSVVENGQKGVLCRREK